MGQFLAVHGIEAHTVQRVFDLGLAAFRTIYELVPITTFSDVPYRAALFPRLGSLATPGVRLSDGWVAGVGTWFYRGAAKQPALEELARDLATRGFEAINDVDGCFTLIAGIDDAKAMIIATDRLGSMHAYSCAVGTCTAISSSSLVLASVCGIRLDEVGCREFVGIGSVFESRSLFTGVLKLAPATVYTFHHNGNKSENRYWRIEEHLYDRSPSRGTCESLASALADSVGAITKAYPKAVFDLTGGFDSRAVLAAALRRDVDVATVVNGPSDNPDVVTANQIAKLLDLSHIHQEPSETPPDQLLPLLRRSVLLTDGEYDGFEYARTLRNHQRLYPTFDISVNGSGGEVAKGYWWELLYPRVGALIPIDSRRLAARRFATDQSLTSQLFAVDCDLVSHFQAVIERTNQLLAGYPNTAQMDNIYVTLRMQRWQGRIASATSRLWPCVSPFLFRAPLEAALSAPPHSRIRNRLTRRLIEYLSPVLSRVPLAGGHIAAPLRLGNCYRFVPEVIETGTIVLNRVMGNHTNAGRPAIKGSKEVMRELLELRTMKTGFLYNTESLQRARGQYSTSDIVPGPITRLLSLELLCRTLSKA